MNKPYRLVVFDWEGTLGDTLGQVLNTVAVEAKHLGFGNFDEVLARQLVGLGLAKAIKKLFPHLNLHQHEQLLQAVQQSLLSRHTEVFLIPGAKETARQLQAAGIYLAIATNKGQQSLQRALQFCELENLFTVTRTSSQTAPKPSPQMLEEILAEFGVLPEETLMIGDSVSDIEMAKSIGVDAIGFDFYQQQESALRAAGALEVFINYQQVINFMQLPNRSEH